MMPRPTKQLSGQRFGRLRVLSRTQAPGITQWYAQCDCGVTKIIAAQKLLNGHTKSCGCLRQQLLARGNLKHGHARRDKRGSEYRTWVSMWGRCTNSKDAAYKNYGGRGITVCQRWQSFEVFHADMGPRPSGMHASGWPLYTLDRKNNDGNYNRTNCRWATSIQQRHNRRDSI